MLVLRPLPFSSPTSPTPPAAPQDMYCFTGKKTSGNKMAGGSNYVISLDQDETKKSKSADTAIGKIKADRKSMEYTLFDAGAAPGSKEAREQPVRRELMHVHFINSLRNRNPGVMHVAVPAVAADGTANRVTPAKEGVEGLEERLKVSEANSPSSLGVEVFKNREPKFNPESQVLLLHKRRSLHSACLFASQRMPLQLSALAPSALAPSALAPSYRPSHPLASSIASLTTLFSPPASLFTPPSSHPLLSLLFPSPPPPSLHRCTSSTSAAAPRTPRARTYS